MNRVVRGRTEIAPWLQRMPPSQHAIIRRSDGPLSWYLDRLVRATACLAMSLAVAHAADILVLAERGFNVDEYWNPEAALTAAGYRLVIASSAPGPVLADPDGRKTNPERDLTATLAIADIANLSSYAAIMVPGGYSPAHLERQPAAIALVQRAIAEDLPIGFICHGPRLLMSAERARNRVLTSLHTVPDELADIWRSDQRGIWIDTPVVVDGRLVTSRSPIDTTPFAQRLMEVIAAAGRSGSTLQPMSLPVRLSIVAPKFSWSQRNRWRTLSALGGTVEALDAATLAKRLTLGGQVGDALCIARLQAPADPAFQAAVAAAIAAGIPVHAAKADADQFAGAVVYDDATDFLAAVRIIRQVQPRGTPPATSPQVLVVDDGAAIAEVAVARQVLAAIGPVAIARSDGRTQAIRLQDGSAIMPDVAQVPDARALRTVRQVLERADLQVTTAVAGLQAPPPVAEPATAYIALRPGFDPAALAVIRTRLALAKMTCRILADQPGPVPGLGGGSVAAQGAYAATPIPAAGWIWCPGGLWPEKRAAVRLAQQPAWIDDQDRADRARRDWLFAAMAAGARIATVGFDGLHLGSDPRAKGLKVAASEQALWSFPAEGASYAAGPSVQTCERWTSYRSWMDITLEGSSAP